MKIATRTHSMKRLTILDTPIEDLKVIQRQLINDSRGFLTRLFCAEELADAGWCKPVSQINHTFTEKRGTIRGMHFQRHPFAEIKLVTCLRGAIWDVAVDLRIGSPTYLDWHAEELSGANGRSLLIPEGFAHGFQTLSDNCELVYLHSNVHSPNFEAGVNIKDPELSIRWPLDISEISVRDSSFPMISIQFEGVNL